MTAFDPASSINDSPARRRAPRRVDDPDFIEKLDALIRECGGDPSTFDGKLIRDLAVTSFKLITDDRDTGELKLMAAALKELRYGYNVFADYAEPHKVSIYGSARTQPSDPDYALAREFSRRMAGAGWLVITGAGDGIMKAGHEGPGRESSFGLSIRLPFETNANTVIKGDSKLISFRYFFTRKLMFVSQCEAFAVFPGGFGTMDELFESLTLVQTGKSGMVPIILMEHEGGDYWKRWDEYVRACLLDRGMIGEEDTDLYLITSDPAVAVDHITRFYSVYHSSRYVRDDLIIRLNRSLPESAVEALNDEFALLVREGRIVQRGAYEVEEDHLDLPRITFTHTRRHIGLVKRMIERINEFGGDGGTPAR